LLGGCGERGGEIWVDWDFSERMKAECGSIWGILAALGKLQIGSIAFTWSYRRVKKPEIGNSSTVLELKRCFRENLEVEGSFGGLLR
jgi:hypothetical protein